MNIGIIIEMETGRVKDANFGMITLARKSKDVQLTALMLDGWDQDAVSALEKYGIDRIADIALPGAPGERQNPDIRARALSEAAEELGLDTIFGLSTAGGKDLIPRVAALAEAPLIMDCMDVDLETRTARTSQYSGKVLADIQLAGALTMFGIRPNAVPPSLAPGRAELLTIDKTGLAPGGLTLVSWDQAGKDGDQPSLSEADIIVAGGRGVQGKENFKLLFDCAKKLNAAVGASRAAVDEHWIPYAHQVGQTGEKVSPSVYLALGISGSVQHFAGMKTSGTIIAVNIDENAAMMANADYYVNADLFEVLPELIRQLGRE
ncbi:MAG: electron transfer flavoprotein subunit alpha/FixB family protein [Desulfobacter sp.]|nr:MAG: electron transfer flavoprotein subunit alpha/FixB family protein [Desulfobacter sp.]